MAERGIARRQYQQAYYQSRKEELQKRHREYYWATENRCLRNIARIEKNIRNIVASIIWQIEKKIRKAQEYRRRHYHKPNTERMEKGAESNDAN